MDHNLIICNFIVGLTIIRKLLIMKTINPNMNGIACNKHFVHKLYLVIIRILKSLILYTFQIYSS